VSFATTIVRVREGIRQVRLRHGTPGGARYFDDPNLVSCAGLEPVMRLAESCDLHGIVREKVHVPRDKGSNAAGKVATIVAGMVAGADSIDDLDVMRHGGMPALFGTVYAPSTLGSFLREFTHGHVLQLQSASREFLVQLARRTPLLSGAEELTFVDVDSMLRRVYGKKKSGAAFGHTKIGGYNVRLRGYNPLIAILSTPDSSPVVAATRLRAGNAGSARGAASFVAEAIGVLVWRPLAVGPVRSCAVSPGGAWLAVVAGGSVVSSITAVTVWRTSKWECVATTRVNGRVDLMHMDSRSRSRRAGRRLGCRRLRAQGRAE
jgi:hypothetical protein